MDWDIQNISSAQKSSSPHAADISSWRVDTVPRPHSTGSSGTCWRSGVFLTIFAYFSLFHLKIEYLWYYGSAGTDMARLWENIYNIFISSDSVSQSLSIFLCGECGIGTTLVGTWGFDTCTKMHKHISLSSLGVKALCLCMRCVESESAWVLRG